MNGTVRIHYEVVGSGPPIVLQHATMGSLQGWFDKGYVEALQSAFQLILVDARGHAENDKPHDSTAYNLDRRIGDIVSMLDDLDVGKAPYWGYSMGG